MQMVQAINAGNADAVDLGAGPFADQGDLLVDLRQPRSEAADGPLQGRVGADQRPLAAEVPGGGVPVLDVDQPEPGPLRQEDLQGADMTDTRTNFVGALQYNQRLNWFGTARGRIGWTNGPVLFYGTGGLAFGQVDTDVALADFNFGTPINTTVRTAQTKTGWTAGFGAEARLFGNWTGKVEYLYLDLGHVGAASFNEVFTPPPSIIQSQQFVSSFHDHAWNGEPVTVSILQRG